MGKIVIIMVIVITAIISTMMVSVNTRSQHVPEMLASSFQDIGSYALQYAVNQIRTEQISESTTIDYADGEFEVLSGQINSIEYVFVTTTTSEVAEETTTTTTTTEVFIAANVSMAINDATDTHDSRAKIEGVSVEIIDGGSSTTGGENELTISGMLNINPGTSADNEFQMQTPSGYIDRNEIHTGAPEFSYDGSASIVRVKPKAQGRTLTINGVDIVLATNTRYEILSDNMTVSLWNDKIKKGKAMGRFWITINATNATIDPLPDGVSVGDEDEEEGGFGEDESTEIDYDILYWNP